MLIPFEKKTNVSDIKYLIKYALRCNSLLAFKYTFVIVLSRKMINEKRKRSIEYDKIPNIVVKNIFIELDTDVKIDRKTIHSETMRMNPMFQI